MLVVHQWKAGGKELIADIFEEEYHDAYEGEDDGLQIVVEKGEWLVEIKNACDKMTRLSYSGQAEKNPGKVDEQECDDDLF